MHRLAPALLAFALVTSACGSSTDTAEATTTTTAAPAESDGGAAAEPTSECESLYVAEAEALEAALTAVRSDWADATVGDFTMVAEALDDEPAMDAPMASGCAESEAFLAANADTYPQAAILTTSFLSSEAPEEPEFLESCESTVAWYEGLMAEYDTAADLPLTIATDLFVATFSAGMLCADDAAFTALTESAEFEAFNAPLDDL